MSEDVWRPLGIDSDEQVAEYDALHDGVSDWMQVHFWRWMRVAVSVIRTDIYGENQFPMANEDLVEQMCMDLQIPLPPIRQPIGEREGYVQLKTIIELQARQESPAPR